MHHSEQKCAHFCSEWCIMGYGTGALWELWIISIVTTHQWQGNASSVLPKVENPGSPNGPSMMGGPYMMWSEMTVKRQHYLYVLFIFKHYHSLPRSLFTSLWDPAISWIFKGTTSIIKIFQSLWNLTVEPPVKIQSNCFQTTHNCQMVKYLSEIH